MGTALTLTGWLCAVLLAAVTASSLARAFRLRPGRRDIRPLMAASLWGCMLAASLTGLGVLGLLNGIVASLALGVVAVVALRKGGAFRAHLAAGPAWLREDIAFGRQHSRRLPRKQQDPGAGRPSFGRRDPGPSRAAATGPGPSAGGDAAGRTIPLLREDPALGPPPPPEHAAAGADIPVPWAELAGWIATFVPEDDNAQSAFLAGNAAGIIAVADAFGALCETVINDIGLDPAYGSALLEVAGRIAETASDVALADQRYHVIYEQLIEAVANGLILPHNTRQWFGGGTAAA